MKTCSVCKEQKPLEDFHREKRSRDGRVCSCKLCARKRSAKWRSENPERNRKMQKKSYEKNKHKYTERQRNYILQKTYSVTQEDYNKMLENQDGCCFLCGEHYTTQLHQVLVVDHCHGTDKVRRLLCRQCNIGLGAFKDNIDVLTKAIEYLKEFKTE